MTVVRIDTVEDLRRFLMPFTDECPIEGLFLEYTGESLRVQQPLAKTTTPAAHY
jgi:hypothetical protein